MMTGYKKGHKRIFKKMASEIGDKVAGLRKQLKIILVIGAWLLVVTVLLTFGI